MRDSCFTRCVTVSSSCGNLPAAFDRLFGRPYLTPKHLVVDRSGHCCLLRYPRVVSWSLKILGDCELTNEKIVLLCCCMGSGSADFVDDEVLQFGQIDLFHCSTKDPLDFLLMCLRATRPFNNCAR